MTDPAQRAESVKILYGALVKVAGTQSNEHTGLMIVFVGLYEKG